MLCCAPSSITANVPRRYRVTRQRVGGMRDEAGETLQQRHGDLAGDGEHRGGITLPKGIAIDGAGNVWLANFTNSSVSEFSKMGVAITPSTGYTSAGVVAACRMGSQSA